MLYATLVIQNILKLHSTWVLSGKVTDNFINVDWNVQMNIHLRGIKDWVHERTASSIFIHVWVCVAMVSFFRSHEPAGISLHHCVKCYLRCQKERAHLMLSKNRPAIVLKKLER